MHGSHLSIVRRGYGLILSRGLSNVERQLQWTQSAPQLKNPFTNDVHLRRCVNKYIPKEDFTVISEDLTRFGDRIVDEIDALGRQCDLQPPYLRQYDAWGNRIDEIVTCAAWNKMKKISAEEGLVAIGYETNKSKIHARLHQFTKLFLYSASAGLYTCPLAMTDGAAKSLVELNLHTGENEIGDVYRRLTSRDISQFWTSGQWITEKEGGSDVAGGTRTLATAVKDGSSEEFLLHGLKWFSSAIDGDMALALGRSIGDHANPIQGTKGLSLFYLPMRIDDGKLNGIQILNLKNKMGTRQLPTAEIILDGTKAIKISEEGKGVSCIGHMLNISRLHNAMSSVAAMRRVLTLSRDYMHKRHVFGGPLSTLPLHTSVLTQMEVETRGCTALLFHCVYLLGLQEENIANPMDLLQLQILIPILKLYTAKMAVNVVSEGIETFGGQGYLEDTGLGGLMRDVHVLPIWEGTTNVLSMHVLSLIRKDSEGSVKSLRGMIEQLMKGCDGDGSPASLGVAAQAIKLSMDSVSNFVLQNPNILEMAARDLSFSIARISAGALLVDHAMLTRNQTDIDSAIRWCYEAKLDQTRSPGAYENAVVRANTAILHDA